MGLIFGGYGTSDEDTAAAGVPVLRVQLTKHGRELLARNGALGIVKWAAFDDGVDYSLWDPSLADPGENIKKLPVLEPISAEGLALRSRLITVSDPTLTYIPSLTFVIGKNQHTVTLTEQTSPAQPVNVSVDFDQTGFKVAAGMVDSQFLIEVDAVFLSILKSNQSISPVVSNGSVAQFLVPADSGRSSSGGGVTSFSVVDAPLTDNDWNIYGQGSVGSREIRTEVRVQGVDSGLVRSLPVVITEKSGLHN
jgi:hypothetical protein